jgi:hypothetical protein
MANDFYLESLQERLAQLDAERAAHLADLQAHRSNQDKTSAAAAIQDLANCDAARENVMAVANKYVASQQPPAPVPQTAEELQVKSWDKMTPDDALQLAKTSKYGKSLDWSDVNVQAGFREAQRRRSRGE